MIHRSRSRFLCLRPFVAYLPAERLHASGVLATVAAGIFIGWHSPLIVTARFRLQAFAFWEMVVFLLNSFVFIVYWTATSWNSARTESRIACLRPIITALSSALRLFWCGLPGYCRRHICRVCSAQVAGVDYPIPRWQDVAVVSWSGMRGVVSLAAAFALPLALSNGSPFPGRNYILFFAFLSDPNHARSSRSDAAVPDSETRNHT